MIIRIAVTFVLLALFDIDAHCQQLPQKVRLSLSAEKPTTILHEPVYAVLSIQNQLLEEVRFDSGPMAGSLQISITLPDGAAKSIPSFMEQLAGGMYVITKVSLKPGETYPVRLLLNQWYDFPVAGNYMVQAQSDILLTTASGTTTQLAATNALQVTVGPRDDERLRQWCAEFSKIALSSSEQREKSETAGLALSYVYDPVAIPFLKELVEHDPQRIKITPAVIGLLQIGTDDAVNVLMANLDNERLRRQIQFAIGLWQPLPTPPNKEAEKRISEAIDRK